jgi:hypothetical protein
MSANAQAIIRRLAALRTMRQPHEQGWSECFDFSFPERSHGLNGSVLLPQDAQAKKNRILDDTAADSARILSSAIVSGTTPANSLWFGLDAGQESDEENRWLDEASRVVFENIHGANFDSAAFECCVDIVGAGWFVLYIDEAKDGGYHFEQWPLGQCFVSASRAGGPVDTIYRELELTAEQMVAEYGLDKVSKKVSDAYQNEKYDEKFGVVHAIYPRQIHAVNGRMAKNLPFASCHIEVGEKHTLRESGYHEFPCVVPRWMLVPGSPYATGPMAQALGSIRTINDIKAMELMNLDMAAAGMYVAEDDGVLNPRAVKIGPRKVIVANSVESIKPLAPAGDFNVVFSAEDRLQAAIRKALLADQLQPQNGPAMTATEVHVRVQLIRQLLGPIYGRLQAEYLQPLVTRCFGIAYRTGILGMAPESLQDRVFTVKYLGPLARAQRLEDVTAMDRMETTLMQESQADPTVLDLYDFEEAARERSNFLGVPQRLMRSAESVQKIRDERAKAQKNQQQQQAGMQMQQAAGEEMLKRVAVA